MDPERLILIGASAGGVEAVSKVTAGMPVNSRAAVVVALHFPPGGTSLLPQILSRVSSMHVAHATDGVAIEAGRIYIAPPDHHLIIREAVIGLTRGPKENGFRPAIDVTFRSGARAFRNRVIGLVLSGNLDDGTAGLRAISRCGGITVAQDPADALYPSMPTSAVRNADPDHIATLAEIPGLLERLLEEPPPEAIQVAEELDIEVDAAEMDLLGPRRAPGLGTPSGLTCPECHGGLWEIDDLQVPRFRCRVGHAYTAETLGAHQADSLEAALWSAVTALHERADLARRMESRMRGRGYELAAERFRMQAENAEARATTVLRVLGDDERASAAGHASGESEPQHVHVDARRRAE